VNFNSDYQALQLHFGKIYYENETANIALMFVPSHAVFDYINASSQNFMERLGETGVVSDWFSHNTLDNLKVL
jgi:DNA anti-recombination protein RmuC